MGFIYAFYSKSINRVYIGQTVCIPDRLRDHLRKMSKGVHPNKFIQRHINKYGQQDLEFLVLEQDIPKHRLAEREQTHINNHEALGFQLFNLLKAQPVSEISLEVRQKMAEHGRRVMANRIITPETCAKISASKKGIPNKREAYERQSKTLLTNGTHRDVPIIMVDHQGSETIFRSAAEAARAVNGDSSVILKVAKGLRNKHKGYGFKLVDPC